MKRLFLASAALLAAASLSTAAVAGPELIQNGTFAGGSTFDWTTTVNSSGAPDTTEVNASSVYGLPKYNGDTYNLEVNANDIDTVTQLVTGLVVGQYYDLSWGYGNRGDGGPQALAVTFGGVLLTTDTYDGSDNKYTWTANSFLIEATATSELLSFASIDKGGSPSYGNEISDVTLIPEPASLAMLVMGLTGIGVLRRRRA